MKDRLSDSSFNSSTSSASSQPWIPCGKIHHEPHPVDTVPILKSSSSLNHTNNINTNSKVWLPTSKVVETNKPLFLINDGCKNVKEKGSKNYNNENIRYEEVEIIEEIIEYEEPDVLNWTEGVKPEVNATANYIDNHILSVKGFDRAHALVSYFLHREEMRQLFADRPLAGIFAQDVDLTPDPWGQSERPKQTVEPLIHHLRDQIKAIKNGGFGTMSFHEKKENSLTDVVDFETLGEQLNLFTKKETHKLIQEVLSPKFEGKSVIICWYLNLKVILNYLNRAHQELPKLARFLGATEDLSVPQKWGKRFDVTWVLMHNRDGVKFLQYPQRLLFGDKNSVIGEDESDEFSKKK
ncbi:hypothetical protein HDU92_003852 [Lobulomyces angularis]|nr:hypothetical protein HDU92_003852 [Lobulomyces angularis]